MLHAPFSLVWACSTSSKTNMTEQGRGDFKEKQPKHKNQGRNSGLLKPFY